MGFVSINLVPLFEHHERSAFSGAVLCLGAPHLHLDGDELLAVHQQSRSTWAPDPTWSTPDQSEMGAAERGKRLLRSLGFSRVDVLDVSDFEGANILLDLNRGEAPDSLLGAYDLIIDHGSLEHVFNLPHALTILDSLLAPDGRVFHSSPGSNFCDHGFYSLSPTFFFDYYSANQWQIERIDVYRMTREPNCVPFYSAYMPGLMDSLSYGGLDANMYGTICMACRTPSSTSAVWPMQGRYANSETWRHGLDEEE